VKTALSFVENAHHKSRHRAAASGLPALADDSGFAVDALEPGAPGILLRRYAGRRWRCSEQMPSCWKRWKAYPPSDAAPRFYFRYWCLMMHAKDPDAIICERALATAGFWTGSPRFAHGFGYDPCSGVA